LRDTFVAIQGRPRDRRTLHFWEGAPNDAWKVGHIFVSKRTGIRDAQIVDVRRDARMPSDHYPVMSKVALPDSKE